MKLKFSHLCGFEPARREVIVGGLGRRAPLARETLAVRPEHPARKLHVPGRLVLLADCGFQVRGFWVLRSVSLLEEIPDHSHCEWYNATIIHLGYSIILMRSSRLFGRDVVSADAFCS